MRELKQIDVAEFVKPEKKKRAKKEKKSYWKGRLALIIILGIGVAYGIEKYADWRAGHQYRPMVVFQKPWVAIAQEKQESVFVEALTNEQMVANSRHPEEIDMIWLLESGRGTNDNPQALHNYCKSKGETNEFGYGGMNEMICFKTFQESVDRVSQWLDIRKARIYCEYSTGNVTTDCSYVDRVAVAKLD